MSGGGGSPITRVMGQIDAANAKPANTGGAAYTPIKQGPVYQPQYQAYQPTVPPKFDATNNIQPVTHDVKPTAGPSNFTPMPIMANDPVSQFGDKPPIPSMPQQPASQAALQQPQFNPFQQQIARQQQFNPFQQQPFQQQQMRGLQAAMMQMMQQYSRPMMRAPMQQGLMPYNSPALNYRPNMSTANLNRVAPSVELQQKQAAEAAANASQGGGE